MSDLLIRLAEPGDLEAIIRLHEEDELGGHGDAWTPANRPAYEAAFAAIARSPENELFVALSDGELVGTFQLTFIPNLTGRGALRVKVESVKVKAARRSLGIGARMMGFAPGMPGTRGPPCWSCPPTKPARTPTASTSGWASPVAKGFKMKL